MSADDELNHLESLATEQRTTEDAQVLRPRPCLPNMPISQYLTPAEERMLLDGMKALIRGYVAQAASGFGPVQGPMRTMKETANLLSMYFREAAVEIQNERAAKS